MIFWKTSMKCHWTHKLWRQNYDNLILGPFFALLAQFSEDSDFSQTSSFCKKLDNNNIFHLLTKQVHTGFCKLKKPHLWAIFKIFPCKSAKPDFFQKIVLLQFLAPNLSQKIKNPITRTSEKLLFGESVATSQAAIYECNGQIKDGLNRWTKGTEVIGPSHKCGSKNLPKTFLF